MNVAVVGHVEWVEFARVSRVPAAGEIAHAQETWQEPGGGGAVAAVQLARLAGEAAFFTALADDEMGRRSAERLRDEQIEMHVATRKPPQRRAFTYVDDEGERTITVIGERLAPRGEDKLPWYALSGFDAVYFCAGDAAALRAARSARLLIATPRANAALSEAGVRVDALVHSSADEGEAPAEGIEATLVVSTEGDRGGSWRRADGATGRWSAASLTGPIADTYGCGDAFAAGLTYGLAMRKGLQPALALAARCGAAVLSGRGPYTGMVSLQEARAADVAAEQRSD